jgi:hypothetical protein
MKGVCSLGKKSETLVTTYCGKAIASSPRFRYPSTVQQGHLSPWRASKGASRWSGFQGAFVVSGAIPRSWQTATARKRLIRNLQRQFAGIQDTMTRKFKIMITRIETVSINDADDFAQVTFRIQSGPVSFYFPVLVNKKEFDDADLPKVARSILHDSFTSLTRQTDGWKLTDDELTQLSSWKFYQGA